MMRPADDDPTARNWGCDAALVRGLMHARAGRRPYVRQPGRLHEKELNTLIARAALAGFTLVQIEDATGCEVLIATRGAETIRFQNRQQAGAWLNHLGACGALGQAEVRSHGVA
jgi:hypothetical protein